MLADSVRLKPMQFRVGDRTILESNGRGSLHFSPVATSVQPNESRMDANSVARSNRFGAAVPRISLKSSKRTRHDTFPKIRN
jgi:hypothetical protein